MKLFLFLIGLIVACASSANATTRVIAASGGSGSTCSYESPCTWSQALSDSSTGDVIQLKAGTYTSAITVNKSVTVQAYPGETPVLDGQSVTSPMIWIGASNVVIDGLTVYRAGNYGCGDSNDNHGIAQYGAYSGTVIRNCTVSFCPDAGILIYQGSGFLIEDNVVHDVNYQAYNCPTVNNPPNGSGWSGAIVAAYTKGGGNIIRRNTVYSSNGEGIQCLWDGNGVTVEYNAVWSTYSAAYYVHSSDDVTFRYNLAYGVPGAATYAGIFIANEGSGNLYNGCGAGSGHVGDTTNNISVYGNVVANFRHGIGIENIYAYCETPKNVNIINNTVIGTTEYGLYIWAGKNDVTQVIKNNIFWPFSGYSGYVPSSGSTFGYNIWNGAPTSYAQAVSDITYSPGSISNYFQRTTGWSTTVPAFADFALRSTATDAIDTASALSTYAYLLDLSSVNASTKTFPLVSQATAGAGYDVGAGPYGGVVEEIPEIVAPTGAISRAGWSCTVEGDSEENTGMDGSCENVFDANLNTAWHTCWSSSCGGVDADNDYITLALGTAYDVTGLRYAPRQVSGTNGTCDSYSVYTSANGVDFTKRVDTQAWSWSSAVYNDATWEQVDDVTHVRLECLSDTNDSSWVSASEIWIVGVTTPPTPGVVQSWTFSDGAETAATGNDWTLNGTTAAAVDHEGESDEAIGCAASAANSISIADGTAPEFGADTFSIAVWAYTNAAPDAALHPLLAKWADGQKAWNLLWNDKDDDGVFSNAIIFWATDGGSDWPPDVWLTYGLGGNWQDAWHHVVVTRDGTSWKLYVDGQLRASQTIACTVNNGTAVMYGFRDGEAHYLDGRLDDTRIYNTALTAEEVATLYAMGTNFASEIENPLAISALTRSKLQVTPNTPMLVTWDYVGDSAPTTCTLNGEEVTCAAKEAYVIFSTSQLGYNDITLTITDGVEEDTETLSDVVLVTTYPHSDGVYVIGPDAGTTEFANLVVCDDDIITATVARFILNDPTLVSLADCTSVTSVAFEGSYTGTLTLGGQTVTQWPTLTGPVTIGGEVGAGSSSIVIDADTFD